MTKTEFAAKIGISRGWLYRITNAKGKASNETCIALAAETKSTVHPWMTGNTEVMLAILDDYLSKQKQRHAPSTPVPPKKIRTLSGLAKKCGCTKNWLSKIKNDKATPSYSLAKKLAAETNSNVSDWMEGHSTAKQYAIELYLYGKPIDEID